MAERVKPPEGYASWIEAAIGMIDPTDMIATGEDTEPVVGGEAINLALAELAEFRAFKTAYDEAMAKITEVLARWDGTADEKMYRALKDYVKVERDSGRFKP